MREKRLIEKGSPCDTDFTDKTIQSVLDARERGKIPCSNLEQCQKRSPVERVGCYRTIARQMAVFILNRELSFEEAVQVEKDEYLNDSDAPDGKFWVCRDEEWQIVQGKEKAIDDIVAFARVIIDWQPDDRRPFTKDGIRPEFGPSDAIHNAMLDLDDVYGEVGQENPFR